MTTKQKTTEARPLAKKSKEILLPLLRPTPARWAKAALVDIPALLNDHAHLEKKAAINALQLLPLWPDPVGPKGWVKTMAAIARDEIGHLGTVLRMMDKRNKAMTKSHNNPYAQELQKLMRRGEGPADVADKLMISALIEGRSCERFKLLADAASEIAPDLSKLYHSLWSSEHGHYRVFLDFAEQVIGMKKVESRWQELLRKESEIISSLDKSVSMHSWI